MTDTDADATGTPAIAVIGTGPAGLVAALTAAQAGLPVVLVGPPPAADDRRTTALLGGSLDHLAALGLGDALEAIGAPLETMRLVDGSRRLVRAPTVSFEASEIGRQRFGLNLPNSPLNAALSAAVDAQGSIARIEGTVATYRLGADGPAAVLRDGTVVRARAILAGDGRNSPAREAAGIGVRRWSYPQTAAVGVVRHARPHHFVSTELHTETGPYTFVPMPDAGDGSPRSSFVCALAPDEAGRLRAMDLPAASAFLEARSLHVAGALALEAPVQLWPLEGLVARAFAARGVYLVGEAAHAFPPIGAQGLNLSIRDALDAVAVIGEALARGEDPAGAAAAERFTARRRADVWARTFGVDALNRSLLTDSPLVGLGRAAALGAARALPAFKKGLMRAGLEPFGLRPLLSGLMAEAACPTRRGEPAATA